MLKIYCTYIICIIFIVAFPVKITDFSRDNHIIDSKNIVFGSDNNKVTYVNEELFSNDEYEYSQKLATESFRLSAAAFSYGVNDENWGENKALGRDKGIIKYFSENSFTNIMSFNYDIGLNDYSSKVGFAIAKKEYNTNTNIIAIAVRGGNYGLEWVDNFNIGDNSYNHHVGFYKAALAIKSELDKLMPQYNNLQNTIFWISGYSRGGAVANILAALIDDNKESFPCKLYAYTFASPKTAILKKTNSHNKEYRNIFNIISPDDPVYNIPPSDWGFSRYGVSLVLPSYELSDNIEDKKLRAMVAQSFKAYTGKDLTIHSNTLNPFMDVIIKSAKDRNFFEKNMSAPIRDLIKIKMLKWKNSLGIWEIYSSYDALIYIHGSEASEVYNKIKNTEFFKYLNKLGIPIPDDFYVFSALCYINGFKNYDEFFFSELKADDLSKLVFVNSTELISMGHSMEFYLSWLENISEDMLLISYE